MRRGEVIKVGQLPSYRTTLETYDPDKLGLGELMVQQTGPNADDKFCGPMPITLLRTMEASTAIPFSFPWAMRWSNSPTSQWDWIFFADIATAAATRRVGMARLDRLTGIITYDGFITVTFPGTSEAKTVRAFRMQYRAETAGTVGVSGTTLTGSSTLFTTNRVTIGSRIGFGSTNADDIVQWYEVGAVSSDTGITLTTSAGTIAPGTPYIIEDLRAVLIVTSATTSNGGVYVVKGLRREMFSSSGTTVPAATTVDNIRATYFLKDATTGTALVSFGASIEAPIDPQTQHIYVLETLANPVLFKFNLYAPLTLTAGSATSAFIFKTGSGGVLTGTASQFNNGRLAQAMHGPGNGLNCIYFTTTTRVYRTADVSTITGGSTAWLIDNMVEIPPGGVNTFPATSAMSSIEYSGTQDKFIITSSGTAGARSYRTQYKTDSSQFDDIIFVDFKQVDQGNADSTTTPFPSINASVFSVWVEGGMMYAARNGTTAIINQIFAVPLGADWEAAATTNSRIIFPRIACPDIDRFAQTFGEEVRVLGGVGGKNLGMSPQPFRLYYRTAGITDNSGTWTILPWNGDISGVAGTPYIQIMAEFRINNTMIPARLQAIGVLWDDLSTLVNYQLSTTKSDAVNKRIAWWFGTAFGGSVPALRVRLYDASSGGLLVDDNTATPTGTFERSTDDGTIWTTWNNSDRANTMTYLRYTPASLADNIRVRAVLTLN